MKRLKYIIVLVFFTIAFSSCRDKESKTLSTVVKHSGALRTIMSGNIQPVISLDTLSKMKNLYALGAVGNLKGEIQLFNSVPFNSFVIDSSLQIKNDYALKASLLVYAEIKAWESFEIKNCTTKSDLEEQIFKIATEYNIDTIKPFPFLLEGNVKSLDWHVINWKDGDTIHNHKKHKESGLNGTLQNKDVKIIGFYSTKHKAIFTHHTTNMHMHFKTEDDAIAGHIDDLLLNNSITLKLPK
ncbi:acetolactate decarboxylase [Winogradskyella flava]|uniref:acetolactate decarboxylase n=1 Tax=Winogradskyella flava TaxID=1884876 RepID=UPI0024911882|nr:acetolactate decarboxylase [Winogradskyella flava]